ncbi:MAG: MFS transporter, partial [Nitrososphaeria archaeon]
VFTYCSFAALINYSATYAITFLLSLYLQLVRGFGPQMAGLLLISNPVVQATLSPFAGSLSDRMSPRILSSIGMAITAVGLMLFAFLDYNSSILFIILNLVFVGIGFALFSSPNTNALMGSVEKGSFGVASSILATMRQLGMIVSTFIAAAIITLYVGPIEISIAPISSLMSGISWSFVVSSILCSIGVILSFAGVRKERSGRS